MCSVILDSVPSWTVALQAPLSMGFPRQEYWCGLPFPSPGDLPDPRIELSCPVSPALAARFCTSVPPGKPQNNVKFPQKNPKIELQYDPAILFLGIYPEKYTKKDNLKKIHAAQCSLQHYFQQSIHESNQNVRQQMHG